KRTQWVRDKNLTVFSLYSPQHALTEIDLFVEPPLDFETAYRDAVRKEVAPGIAATFIGLQDLRRLTLRAGRPQDLLDLEKRAMSSDRERTGWERGWGGHERQQLERLSRMPLPEKLRWLEEAHHLVLHLSGAAKPAPAPRATDDRRVT